MVARVVVAVVVLEQFFTDEAVVVVVGVGGRCSGCCGCRCVVQVGVVLGRHSYVRTGIVTQTIFILIAFSQLISVPVPSGARPPLRG